MAKSRKSKVEELRGRVVARRVLKGTASEHNGIVLETDDGEQFILQRIGANPFDDEITRDLVGQQVRVTGVRLGYLFRFTDYRSTD